VHIGSERFSYLYSVTYKSHSKIAIGAEKRSNLWACSLTYIARNVALRNVPTYNKHAVMPLSLAARKDTSSASIVARHIYKKKGFNQHTDIL
jgi:hypothetical protein